MPPHPLFLDLKQEKITARLSDRLGLPPCPVHTRQTAFAKSQCQKQGIAYKGPKRFSGCSKKNICKFCAVGGVVLRIDRHYETNASASKHNLIMARLKDLHEELLQPCCPNTIAAKSPGCSICAAMTLSVNRLLPILEQRGGALCAAQAQLKDRAQRQEDDIEAARLAELMRTASACPDCGQRTLVTLGFEKRAPRGSAGGKCEDMAVCSCKNCGRRE